MISQISLSNTTYFKLFIGKRVLKEDIYKSNGGIPIYSANVFKPLGYADTTTITNFQHTYLLWGIDGKFEFNIKHKGEKFETTDHCGAIEILDDDIVAEYLLYQLRIKELGYSFTNKLGSGKLGKIEITLPVGADGKPSLDKQLELRKMYEKVDKIKLNMVENLQGLEAVNVELSS